MGNKRPRSWRNTLSSGFHWLERHSAPWVVIFALLSVIFAAGGIAWERRDLLESPPDVHGCLRFFNLVSVCIYEGIQVLLLNMNPHEEHANVFIAIARVLAVPFFALIAIQAIRRLFGQSFSEISLRARKRNISFVVGLGRLGLQIALDELLQGKLVVVQEPNENNLNRPEANHAGALVLTENGMDRECLREHVGRNPETIHLVTGDDLTNINALANILSLRKELLESGKSLPSTCNCYIHIEHSQMHGSFRRCLLENENKSDPDLKVHAFNIYHETASQLIIDELTPLRPIATEDVALYVVFGFEQMGMAMVKELVEFAHFENLKRSRILVISDDAERDYQKCISHWPRMCPRDVHSSLASVKFDPARDDWGNQDGKPEIDQGQAIDSKAVQYAANVQFCQLLSPGVLSFSEVGELVRLATEPGVCSVFLFCHEADSQNFQMASGLEDSLQDNHGLNKKPENKTGAGAASGGSGEQIQGGYLPIFTFLPRSRPLRDLLIEAGKSNPAAARPFGDVHQGLIRAHDTFVEDLAFEIAYDYHVNDVTAKLKELEKQKTNEQQVKEPNQNDSKDEAAEKPRVQTREEFHDTLRLKPYWEQESNLYAAEHKRILVQLMGYKITEDTTKPGTYNLNFEGRPDEEKKTMALVEHNRWMAERLLINWCYGPYSSHPPQRTSFCIKQYLSKEDWEKDVSQIARTLEILEQQKIYFEKIASPRRSRN